MKFKLILILSLLVIFSESCKKSIPYYPVSDDMKQFFVFQKGSYWIYKNDSTNLIDSTYINSIYSVNDDDGYPGIRREIINLYLNSKFLSDFEVGYFCPGPNCLTIATRLDPHFPLDEIETNGPFAYFSGWQPNKDIVSKECVSGWLFRYSTFPSVTIANNTYQNIIYSRIITTDSTSTNKYFYSREIYFAKNIGIIKFFEKSKYFNIQRSFSLSRYKIIQ